MAERNNVMVLPAMKHKLCYFSYLTVYLPWNYEITPDIPILPGTLVLIVY